MRTTRGWRSVLSSRGMESNRGTPILGVAFRKSTFLPQIEPSPIASLQSVLWLGGSQPPWACLIDLSIAPSQQHCAHAEEAASSMLYFYHVTPFCSQASPSRSLVGSCSRPEAHQPCLLPTHNQLASKHHSAPAQEPSPNFGSMKRNSPRTNTCIGLRHRRHPKLRERHSLFCSNLQGYARGCSWLLRCSDCPGTWHMAHGRKLP